MKIDRNMTANTEFEVRIRKVRAETSEIRSFEFEAVNGQSLPPFEAGAHISITPIPGLTRQYSLVNNPADRSRYLIGVKRELNGRGGSSAMHNQLQEGGTVLRRERLRPAAGDAHGAQILHHVARRQRHADRGLGEGLAGRADDLRARRLGP